MAGWSSCPSYFPGSRIPSPMKFFGGRRFDLVLRGEQAAESDGWRKKKARRKGPPWAGRGET